MQLLASIIGFIAIGMSLLIFVSTKRERILVFKVCSDALWAVNLVLLSSYTGAILLLFSIARGLVFYHRGKHKWADSPIWLVVFIGASLVSPILSWAGFFDLFPAIGSSLCVVGYYVKNTKLMRVITFSGEALWLLYAIMTKNLTMTISEAFILCSILIGAARQFYQARQKKKFASLSHLD